MLELVVEEELQYKDKEEEELQYEDKEEEELQYGKG